MSNCKLCPRECGADRAKSAGVCRADNTIRIGYIGLHFGEEPPISSGRGSGTVFFSGCPLKCVFCQNAAISNNGNGKIFSSDALKRELLTLSETAENINLVTAGHYLDVLLPILEEIKPAVKVPIIYNSGGYEKVEAIKRLNGIVDVFLPDYKYFCPHVAEKYSSCKDYPESARLAIDEMVRQQSKVVIKDGLIKKGVIIRHLVLPSNRRDSIAVINAIAERWGNKALVSLMSQYTPEFNRSPYPELNRRVTSFEYRSVVDEAIRLNLKGFMQEKTSATKVMTPVFDTSDR